MAPARSRLPVTGHPQPIAAVAGTARASHAPGRAAKRVDFASQIRVSHRMASFPTSWSERTPRRECVFRQTPRSETPSPGPTAGQQARSRAGPACHSRSTSVRGTALTLRPPFVGHRRPRSDVSPRDRPPERFKWCRTHAGAGRPRRTRECGQQRCGLQAPTKVPATMGVHHRMDRARADPPRRRRGNSPAPQASSE